MTMEYKRVFFDPDPPEPLEREEALNAGDRAGRRVYVYSDRIVLAVNIALAANRPLLVSGPPGSGKSSLAANVAASLKWPYTDKVITSRTQARELLWSFDAVRRLHDASIKDGIDGSVLTLDEEEYIKPGVLWDAFESGAKGQRMVVLLDEIDKADTDVPNSLLVALGASEFEVEDLHPPRRIQAPEHMTPLVIVTTNDERELSRPFVRRCVSLTLPAHTPRQLVDIAVAQGLAGTEVDRTTAESLADIFKRLRDEAKREGDPQPSSAEYLDALRACLQLEITPGSPAWDQVERATLRKRLDPDEAEAEADPEGSA